MFLEVIKGIKAKVLNSNPIQAENQVVLEIASNIPVNKLKKNNKLNTWIIKN